MLRRQGHLIANPAARVNRRNPAQRSQQPPGTGILLCLPRRADRAPSSDQSVWIYARRVNPDDGRPRGGFSDRATTGRCGQPLRYGAATTVLEWREKLVCSRCQSRAVKRNRAPLARCRTSGSSSGVSIKAAKGGAGRAAERTAVLRARGALSPALRLRASAAGRRCCE
jgi:hypothetical protein